jgi:hypothetical protein
MTVFSQNVSLSKDTLSYKVSGYAPFKIGILPKGLYNGLSAKIREIVYTWPDGTKEIKSFKPTLKNNSYLDFPEFGNPLNYSVFKDIYSQREDLNEKTNIISVKCSFFGSTDTTTYTISAIVLKPDVEGFENNYFGEITLIDARMYGPNNTLIYVFETKNPNYILMSTVNWQLLPEEVVQRKLPPIRPYKFLLPFDKTVDVGFDYEKVNLQRSIPSQNSMDSGGGFI